jgi:hypothetical protein
VTLPDLERTVAALRALLGAAGDGAALWTALLGIRPYATG